LSFHFRKKTMSAKKQDFIINVPKRDPLKRYSITRFNQNLNVDISQWPNKEVHMRREDNRKEVLNDAIVQDYGAGSAFGQAAREEARRKKYGRQARSYNLDKQPWLLDIKESETKTKKYKSIVERTGEHADYWIFVKQGQKFFAHKVSDWYQFLPQVQHKVLDIEQAEEQFQQRNRVMNQFALKAQIQQQMKDNEEDGGKTVRASNLIIKDKDVISTDEDDEDNEDDLDEEAKKQKKRMKKPHNNPKKDKRVRVENGDEVARYESDDGDDEGREFDYMSDSGSESDRETKTVEEKQDEALVGVGDEQGLKNLIDDRDTDEDEEEDEEGITEEGKDLANKLKEQEEDGEGRNRRDTDESEDEDPDATDFTSPLLLQAKRQDDRKRPATGDVTDSAGSSQPKKIKTEKGSSQQSSSGSMAASGASAVTEREQKNMLEDQIRRLLTRRPHTTKELLSLIRPQFEKVEKTVLVNKLAEVLKVIGPKQFRKLQGKKEVLYFSLDSA
jgi:transcription initiation factor TFIIF subunit alpha